MNAGVRIDVRADLAHIFRAEVGGLTAVLARRTGDFALAEECVQDALVRALECWPRDGIPVRPGAWLMTVARNRALDRLRRDRVEHCKLLRLEPSARHPDDRLTRSSRAAIRRLREKRSSR
jgi:predicted RNA polymerase sigma factor